MTDEEYQYILDKLNVNENDVINSYDAVFHLVTTANGLESLYSLDNNAARYETVEQAVALDQRLMNSWSVHPNLKVIENAEFVNDKMNHLLDEISSFLEKYE